MIEKAETVPVLICPKPFVSPVWSIFSQGSFGQLSTIAVARSQEVGPFGQVVGVAGATARAE